MIKQCVICGKDFECGTNFGNQFGPARAKNVRARSGNATTCSPEHTAQLKYHTKRAYYLEHIQHCREYAREYHRRHPERSREYHRRTKERFGEQYKERRRQKYWANRDKNIERMRADKKKLRAAILYLRELGVQI